MVVLAQKIPGRYIVELSTEPVAEHMARSGDTAGMQSLRAGQQRTRVINEQGRLRSWIESGNSRVLGSVNTVANAIFVEASEAEAQRLATLPGVKRVLPSRQVKLLLDRAALVHKVDAVWNEIGETNGGAGIKVAIIDTGIQNNSSGISKHLTRGTRRIPENGDQFRRLIYQQQDYRRPKLRRPTAIPRSGFVAARSCGSWNSVGHDGGGHSNRRSLGKHQWNGTGSIPGQLQGLRNTGLE